MSTILSPLTHKCYYASSKPHPAIFKKKILQVQPQESLPTLEDRFKEISDQLLSQKEYAEASEELERINKNKTKKIEYFKPTVLVQKQASYQSRPADRQVRDAKGLVMQCELQKALRKTLKTTNVWANDYQVYKLNGSGHSSRSSSRNSSHVYGHQPLLTSRDDKQFTQTAGNFKATILKTVVNCDKTSYFGSFRHESTLSPFRLQTSRDRSQFTDHAQPITPVYEKSNYDNLRTRLNTSDCAVKPLTPVNDFRIGTAAAVPMTSRAPPQRTLLEHSNSKLSGHALQHSALY